MLQLLSQTKNKERVEIGYIRMRICRITDQNCQLRDILGYFITDFTFIRILYNRFLLYMSK